MTRNTLSVAIGLALAAHVVRAQNNNTAALTIEELQNRLLDLSDSAAGIQNRADAENRQLSDDERKQIDEIMSHFEDTEQEIERRQKVVEMHERTSTPRGRRTTPSDNVEPVNQPPNAQPNANGNGNGNGNGATRTPRVESREAWESDRGKWGFRSYADYLGAVMKASNKGAMPDPRLIKNAPTTYGTEGVGADGGFGVPPDFRTEIVQKVMGDNAESLLGKTDQQTSSSNSITFPADETTPWQSSGGIQAYWESEAGQKTQSKPQLKEKTVKLNKLIALVPLTDELLEDANSMANYVRRKAPEKIGFKVSDAILNGTGAGQPKGILTSAGTIEVTPESGQVADTVVFANIVNLYNRLTPSARSKAVWYVHPDVEPQLQVMQFPGTGTAVPAYMPPGGLSASPYATLMGRPVVPHEACQILGDKGDIIFGDLSAYLSVVKTGGIRSDVSIHLYFDYDVTAFRFVLRIGGQPWWDSTITPFQANATTRGFFATLGARA